MADSIPFTPVKFIDKTPNTIRHLHDDAYANHRIFYEHNHDTDGKILMILVSGGKVLHTHSHDGMCKVLIADYINTNTEERPQNVLDTGQEANPS